MILLGYLAELLGNNNTDSFILDLYKKAVLKVVPGAGGLSHVSKPSINTLPDGWVCVGTGCISKDFW